MNKKVLLIFFLAFFLRVWKITDYPVGFTPDEASFGYDAYSILQTGKDQWGKTLPLIFESFGDFKAPLYGYLSIPPVAIFGLNKFAVRLPNAIFGSLSVLIFYFLIRELFFYDTKHIKDKVIDKQKKYETIAVLSSLLFALSPWHIAMSRGAFEANLTTFFLPLGLLLFFKWLNLKRNYYLFLSLSVFGINLFSYHSAKLISVLIVILLFFLFRESFNIKREKVLIFKTAIISSIFVLITLISFFQGAGARVKDVSIYKLSLPQASSERINAVYGGLPDSISRMFHNKYQAFSKNFLSNYVSYFSPQFFFSRGAGERTYGMNDDRGVLYWFEFPLLIFFIYWLFRNKQGKGLIVVLFWFIISPIPAALAIGPGYAANRAVVMLPSIYIFLGIGGYEAYYLLKEKVSRYYYLTIKYLYLIGSAVFIFSFIENYLFITPVKGAESMLYGNLEVMQYIKKTNIENKPVVVSRKLSEPHIFVAYANSWDPPLYQTSTSSWDYKNKGLVWVDQLPEYSLGNYIFRNIHIEEYKNMDVILVGKPDEFPQGIAAEKEFYYPDGKPSILVVRSITKAYANAY